MNMPTAKLGLALLAAGLLGLGCSPSGGRPREKVTGSASDPPVAFELRWVASNRYVFRLDSTVWSEWPRRGDTKPSPLELNVGLDYTLQVTQVASDGGRRLELEVRALQLDSAMGDRTVASFDSESQNAGPDGAGRADRLRRLVGTRVTYQLSPSNKVLRVTGLDRLLEATTGGGVRGAGPMRGAFSPEMFRQLVDLHSLPDRPVRIGQSWTGQRELGGPMGTPLLADLTYTFKGWTTHERRHCALFEFAGPVKAKDASAGRGRGGSLNLEHGTVSGKAWFDPEAGQFADTTLEQNLVFKGAMGGGRRATNEPPQTVVVPSRQHTTVLLVEVEPPKG